MSAKNKLCFAALAMAACVMPAPAQTVLLSQDFDKTSQPVKTIGRGDSRVTADGVFRSQDSYGLFGDKTMRNYRMRFKARAPKDAEQVQIWAGFNAANRYDRYVVGIKGGLQDDLYLARQGYMGTDEFLDIRELGFHPEPGQWIDVTIEQADGRIRVFLNNEDTPRIDLVDKNHDLAPAGYATLGGSWVPTEFDDLVIEQLPEGYFANIPAKTKEFYLTDAQKETKRQGERRTWRGKRLERLNGPRTVISLDGDWLFSPTYETNETAKGASPEAGDESWHVMPVPNFWNPSRIWLHGETMGTPAGHRPKGVSDTYFQKESRRCDDYTFNYRKTDAAWYRQWIDLPADISGKRVTLDFDGVSKICEVYINGHEAAKHIGMFGSFEVDGSKYFKPGRNLIAVKVLRNAGTSGEVGNDALEIYYSASRDNSARKESGANVNRNILNELPHGFYGDNPAGIWRPVKLTVSEPLKVEDVFIRPRLDGADFDIAVYNHSAEPRKFDIRTKIADHRTGKILYEGTDRTGLTLAAGGKDSLTYSINDLQPKLWSPSDPNLYDFTFSLVDNGKTVDSEKIVSGFRTFEVKNGQFELNGHKYALRGGNHTPFALGPNDRELADTFYQLMKKGNLEVTRTHTCPYNELWMAAADENGIGVSYEGTWSWLYIHETFPADDIVDFWENEWIHLMKQMRNHPSLLFWTVNNEMKFYDLDPDFERCKYKMTRISNCVRHMREADPTRPVCFDSNYQAKGKDKKFGADFMATIDDGDIDDVHSYINWYDHTLFRYFKGELQNGFKLADRPLISQEMSTGYPQNETGHTTRSYTMQHQNPQSLIGLQCYEFSNPANFLRAQSFITSELAEGLRRSNDQASGTIHFALLTWFKQVYDAQRIQPWPTYYAMQRAMQPVLVSAELWGRHLYAGEKLPVRFCIVNDDLDGKDLAAGTIDWSLTAADGRVIAKGTEPAKAVAHYGRLWVEPSIILPADLGADRVEATLNLAYTAGGKQRSANKYDLTLASRDWAAKGYSVKGKPVVVDRDGTTPALDALGIAYTTADDIAKAVKTRRASSVILSGINDLTDADVKALRDYMSRGGKVLFLRGENGVKAVFPEHIAGTIKPTEGDIANMDVPESPVFDGLDYFDLRYFNDNRREVPKVCETIYHINRNDDIITPLVMQQKIHGYIDGDMKTRAEHVAKMRGFALLDIKHGKGGALVSSLETNKAATDPVAGRLLANMINEVSK